MTEIRFYHLQGQKLEGVLPTLLEKSLERGWRVVVQGTTSERIEALDAHLWTYRDDSFLAHGTWQGGDVEMQPILLTVNDSNPGEAAVRFLIEGAPLPADMESYERVILVFDGDDEEAVNAARLQWSDIKARGIAASYWQPDEAGRWRQKA